MLPVSFRQLWNCQSLLPGHRPEERSLRLEAVWNTFREKKEHHAVDSYDTSYILLDVRSAWVKLREDERIETSGLAEEIEKHLRELEAGYKEECEKWKF